MTIRSHPDPSILICYASGTLNTAISGVVACHVSMCDQCAADMQKLETIGGIMLDGTEGVQSAKPKYGAEEIQSFESGHALFDAQAMQAPRDIGDPVMPYPLARYLGMTIDDIPWKKLPKGIKQYWVNLPDGAGSMRLLKVPPGTQLLEHSHRGMELTIILKGIYSDHTGDYRRGEVTEMQEGLVHQPRITSEEECICVVACEQPSRYTQWYARLLRPILDL